MTAGYSGTPLARKLGIREGARLGVIGDPGHFGALVHPLPPDVVVVSDPGRPRSPRAGDPRAFDVVVAFVPERARLASRLRHGHLLIDWPGGLWIAWPKMSSGLHRDLRESEVREAGLEAGLVDNKICAVDADWSGLRFVYRTTDRPR